MATAAQKPNGSFYYYIVQAIVLGTLAFFGSAVLELRGFMFETRANRFTDEDARQLEQHIRDDLPPQWVRNALRDLREEQKRIQVQIDRLEGHRPKSYTEDE